MAWLFGWIQDKFRGWRGEELSLQVVLLRPLLPFAVYLLAEHLAFSGILAVVAAGVTVDLTDLHRRGDLATRMQARGLRAMIESVFNGIIFLLLGLQLPQFIGRPFGAIHESLDAGEAWWLVGLTAALWLALRVVWIWGAMRVSISWAKWHGEPRDAPSQRYGGGRSSRDPWRRHVGGRAIAASGFTQWFALPRA
jgi:NhaP-type Na+/H+ or K+/H+ antiporter